MLFTRTHPDFNGMQILSTILGGYFGSRLISNLREERGYTYGIYSTMVNLSKSGYLAISTEVAAEATEDSIRQIRYEMARLRDELVSEEKLTAVKNIMIGDIMRILDGPFGIADVTIENIQNGTDNSTVVDFFNEIKNVTPQRIRELARMYLTEEDFVTVIVGKIP
jgi:predicted Zn-dependent peptidase